MRIENGFYDRKSESRSFYGAGVRFGKSVIPFPDRIDFFLRNTLAGIDDFKQYIIVFRREKNLYGFIFARIVYRVSEKIVNNLLDFFLVDNRYQIGRDVILDRVAFFFNVIGKSADYPSVSSERFISETSGSSTDD